MRAIAYCRVSTEDQATGYSLDVQKEAIRYEIERRGWQTVDNISETASGKDVKGRQMLQGALRLLARGEADVLVVSRFDRLTRSVADFYNLMGRAEKEGWSILCLNPALDMTEPFGRAMAGMAAVFAQLERELNSMRQLESVRARKAAGTYDNGASRRGPRLSLHTEDYILNLRRNGHSLNKIARLLMKDGCLTASGKSNWDRSKVRSVLRRRGDPLGVVQSLD